MAFGLVLMRISWKREENKKIPRNSNSVSLSPSILAEYLTNCKTSCYLCSDRNSCGRESSWFSSRCDDVKMKVSAEEAARSTPAKEPKPEQFSSSFCVEETNVYTSPSPGAVAYVLSTSGTTGRPVAVRATHCSIVPNILDLRSRFNLSPDEFVFNTSPLTFDPSVVEVN